MTEIIDKISTLGLSTETRVSWAETLDPAVKQAREALSRQSKKPSRILELDFETTGKEGIYLFPGYEGVEVFQLGQSRNPKDQFLRGASAHGVAFGLTQVRMGSETRLINVAVKPFYEEDEIPEGSADNKRGRDKARYEAIVNGIVLDRGFSTTEPLCLVIDQGDGYIITPVKKGVQSLDTDLWHQFLHGTQWIRQHFLNRLAGVAKEAADLNYHGINHADGALRNYWTTLSGTIEAFDWESASVTTNPPSPDKLIQIGVSTLRPLYRSIAKSEDRDDPKTVGIIRGPKKTRWKEFDQMVFTPYTVQMMKNLDSNQLLTDEYVEAIEAVEEALKEKIGI